MADPMQDPRLVIVGSIGLDHIETPWEKRVDLLGGSASYACAAASFFTSPGMVGVVGEDFPDEYLEWYKAFRVDLRGLRREPGQTFSWTGVYEENMDNRRTLETVLGVFESFHPHLPEPYRQAPFVFLGNMHPLLQAHVLDQIRQPRFVMVDTMDLWINITRADLVAVIGRVHMLTVNESEARLLTDRSNLLDAASALLDMGPEHILIKKGENGAMLFSRGSLHIQPAFPLAAVRDPTGAGDTFAGALMGYLAREGTVDDATLRRAMLHGGVVASFGVEAFSLERLRGLSPAEIHQRAEELRDMVRI